MKLSLLKIDQDFRDCLPKLSADEYSQLEKNVLQYGLQMPLIIWNDYIIDGHNRYNICFNNNIKEVPTKEMDFSSKDDAIRWILENQLGRRNLSDFARNEIALRYKEVIAKRAKERQGTRTDLNRTSGSNDQKVEDPINTRTEIAKIAGTNDSSVKRTEYILKNGTEEEIDRARSGGRGNSQSAIYGEIKTRITPPGMKTCSTCLQAKPIEEFRKDSSSKDGLASNCKACHNEIERTSKTRKTTGGEMTISQIKKRLKDENADVSLTEKDVVAMIEANLANFIASVKSVASMDYGAFNRCKDNVKEIIESGITNLYEEVL